VQVRFAYSISNSPGPGKGVVQLHDQVQLVEVDGAPDAHGDPSHQQLAAAERKFLDWFAADKPGGYLIGYVSGPADGSKGRYSEYRAYLPA
jgi:hypothetical protein